MNEIKKNPFVYICIILVILSCVLGADLFNTGKRITEIEGVTKELRKQNRGFKLGFDIISRESQKREKVNRELRSAIEQLEKDKGRYTGDLDSIYTELNIAKRELDRIRREAEARSREAIEAGEDIGREIEILGEIITEIEKGKID